MCFSATASFVASSALSATGVVTMKKVRTKAELPFAAIPLLFGIQQGIEGFVWLSLGVSQAPLWGNIATYGYVFFAYVLWPIFVPFALIRLETIGWRKKVLGVFQVIGLAVGLYLLSFIMTSPVISMVVGKSIVYNYPHWRELLVIILYILATSISCLFSSHRMINFFGIAVLVALFVAYYFYTTAFVSVWCFFAAVLSLFVYGYLKVRG